MGLEAAPEVMARIREANMTIVFVNTRAQAELMFQALWKLNDPTLPIALHHGSLEVEQRRRVEAAMASGKLRAVVATSSLDLGIDWAGVDQVIQIGAPKGVARLLQRAGRSGHAPGRASRITLVPSNTLELIEDAAVQSAIARGRIESRSSPLAPLDVLVQHLVTIALGGGFRADELLEEVRDTAAYENLSEESWRWCLDFVRQGGPSLTAYPDFRRAAPDKEGVWRVSDRRIAQRHRLNIGAIVSDASVIVQYLSLIHI